MITGKPYSHKVTALLHYKLKDNMLCTTGSDSIPTLVSYRAGNALAEITTSDILNSAEQRQNARDVIMANIGDEREYCTSYWRGLSDGNGTKIVFAEYIDGVLQPFDSESSAVFLGKGTGIKLSGD